MPGLHSILIGAYVLFVVVLLFGLSIFVHEFGHYIAARWCGMVIDTFSLGFGPALWKRKRGGTLYKIGCIPVGGYVALPQLDPANMRVVQGRPDDAQEGKKNAAGRQLPPIAPWKKIIVSLMGAAGNLLLAVILAWIVFATGRPVLIATTDGAVIGDVDPASPAYACGLRAGDTILEVNGASIKTWHEFMQAASLDDRLELKVAAAGESAARVVSVPTTNDAQFGIALVAGLEEGSLCKVGVVQAGSTAAKAGLRSGDIIRRFDGVRVASRAHLIAMVHERENREVPMVVEREGQTLDVRVTPAMDPAVKMVRIGIVFDSMVMTPGAQLRHDATAIVRLLKALLTPRQARKAAQGLGGPVSILAMFWLYTQAGILLALGFTRFLNVNLAILNLLPIPVLDGGHILFALWEGATGRPASEKVVGWLVNIFAVFLIACMLLLTYRDLFRWLPLWHSALSERVESATTNAPGTTAEPSPAPAPP
jgi:regulator of sigma E protease